MPIVRKTRTVQQKEANTSTAGIRVPVRGTVKEVEQEILSWFSYEISTEDEIRSFAKADVDTIEAGKG
jgi:hypothetical protein